MREREGDGGVDGERYCRIDGRGRKNETNNYDILYTNTNTDETGRTVTLPFAVKRYSITPRVTLPLQSQMEPLT